MCSWHISNLHSISNLSESRFFYLSSYPFFSFETFWEKLAALWHSFRMMNLPWLGKCHPLQATEQVTSYYGQIIRKSALPKVGIDIFWLYLLLCLVSSSWVWLTAGQILSILRSVEVLIQSTICQSLVYKMKVSVSWYFLSHSTVSPFLVHASDQLNDRSQISTISLNACVGRCEICYQAGSRKHVCTLEAAYGRNLQHITLTKGFFHLIFYFMWFLVVLFNTL